MSNTPKVLDLVVKNDLCIGCGVCIHICPEKALSMDWNEQGFLVPKLVSNCNGNGYCVSVCPFNPFPENEIRTENEIGGLFLKDTTNTHKKIGRYTNIYAGYSLKYRATSSSGGIATYILEELLKKGIVDHVFSVKEVDKPGVHFEYSVLNSENDLLSASGTKYFPVTLATVLSQIKELEGKVAIVGVGCFIKAIRLFQYKEPELRHKIPFLVGIICGGIKSRFFTEYLAEKAGVSRMNYHRPQFRMKNIKSAASDYSFGCENENNDLKTINMRTVGDMWGTGLFKSNACDFCDDVTTELADISLGDAWLKPYIEDGLGTNVIVTRSNIADNLIQEGLRSSFLNVEKLSLEHFLSSQQGSFNHRHKGLPFRINHARKRKCAIPPKRFGTGKVSFFFKIVQKMRIIVRRRSIEVWSRVPDIKLFDKILKKHLVCLYYATRIYHFRRLFRK